MRAVDVDDYIRSALPYAQPILTRVRAAVMRAGPEVAESIKWGHPSFAYRGRILAVLAAFKNYVRFHFWDDLGSATPAKSRSEAGCVGARSLLWKSLGEVPPDAQLDALIAAALRRREAGKKASRPAPAASRTPRPALTPPPEFLQALNGQSAARQTFDELSPSGRREYIEWIINAKREATRAARIETAIAWLGEGKPFNWKYQRPRGVPATT